MDVLPGYSRYNKHGRSSPYASGVELSSVSDAVISHMVAVLKKDGNDGRPSVKVR